MPQYPLTDKRIWITGASSGIGEALARALAEEGARLVLSARRKQKLSELADDLAADTLVVPLDVTERSANHEVMETVVGEWGGLDCAILNAGISEHAELESPSDFDAEAVERITRVNYLGMIYGVEACLPLLEDSPAPYLVAMSSASAYGSLPRAGAYGASKTAIKYFFESMQYDLEPFDIPVSIICPGFVETPLTDKNDFPMPFLISPDEATNEILHGLRCQQPEIHFPRRLTYLLKLVNRLPKSIYRWGMKKVAERVTAD